MKKLVSILLVMSAVFCLASCSLNQETVDYDVEAGMKALLDPEVSVRFSPDGMPYGPGSDGNLPGFPAGEEAVITKQKSWEPVYCPGDYWYTVEYPGFTAICYFTAADDCGKAYEINTTRDDVQTYGGVSVGDTREKVLEAYPDKLCSIQTWYSADDENTDFLWYNPQFPNDPGNNYGPCIIFYFEQGKVSAIKLADFFN